MLRPYKIEAYRNEFHPQWACAMPAGCPPEDVLVADNHPFFRLALHQSSYDERDFLSYADLNPEKDWGEMLPLAAGLSIMNDATKARKNLKLPVFRKFKGIIALVLQPTDGVVKQTGVHRSHYTWWRTKSFSMSNLSMLSL